MVQVKIPIQIDFIEYLKKSQKVDFISKNLPRFEYCIPQSSPFYYARTHSSLPLPILSADAKGAQINVDKISTFQNL